MAITEIVLMEQLLTILLKMRTIQCLETFIPLSHLCYVYPPISPSIDVFQIPSTYFSASFLSILSIPFLEHSISLPNVSDLWQCVALRPRSYKTVLRDHRRMRHVLHSQSCHDFLPCVMHEFKCLMPSISTIQINSFPPALHMHGFMKWQRVPTVMSRKGPAVVIPPQIAEHSV
jgi:hypothetical protein